MTVLLWWLLQGVIVSFKFINKSVHTILSNHCKLSNRYMFTMDNYFQLNQLFWEIKHCFSELFMYPQTFLHLYARVVSSYRTGRKTKFWNQTAKYCRMPGGLLAEKLTTAPTVNYCKESSSFCVKRCVTVRIHTKCLACVK